MKSLKESMDAAIAENMPAMVGDELRRLLDAGEVAAAALAVQTEKVSALEDRVLRLQKDVAKELSENAGLTSQLNIYHARAKDFDDSERRVLVATLKQEAADLAKQDVKELVAMVFRNPVYKHRDYGQLPGGTPVTGPHGNTNYPQTVTVDVTRTDSVE